MADVNPCLASPWRPQEVKGLACPTSMETVLSRSNLVQWRTKGTVHCREGFAEWGSQRVPRPRMAAVHLGLRHIWRGKILEALNTILAAVLANAAVLGVLGWLVKSLLEKLIQRDGAKFAVELQAKANSEIEQYKSDLQLSTIEHQIRFSRLHEKRAEVIAQLNTLMVEALWEAESFLSPIEWAGEPNKREKHGATMEKLVQLYRYFDKHRIYLPDRLCAVVEQLIKDVRAHVMKFGVYVRIDDVSLTDHTRVQKDDAWNSGWEAIKNQIPAVRKELEDEFRRLLGHSG